MFIFNILYYIKNKPVNGKINIMVYINMMIGVKKNNN